MWEQSPPPRRRSASRCTATRTTGRPFRHPRAMPASRTPWEARSSPSAASTPPRPPLTSERPSPPPAFANARPCSIYYGQIDAKFQADFKTRLPKFQGATLPYAPCGYTGPQFQAAYENNSALHGSGVTVASTLWYNSSTITSDINTYATNHGDGAYAPSQFKIVLPQGASTSFRNVTRPACRRSRRWTPRPCTRWRRAPTSCTTPPRAASTPT